MRSSSSDPTPDRPILPTCTVDAPSVRRCARDRKSTRLNSSHRCISYAVFCLQKKSKPFDGRAANAGAWIPSSRTVFLDRRVYVGRRYCCKSRGFEGGRLSTDEHQSELPASLL